VPDPARVCPGATRTTARSLRSRLVRCTKWGKYGGAAAVLLLVALWIGSGWLDLSWRNSSRSLELSASPVGEVSLLRESAPWPTRAEGVTSRQDRDFSFAGFAFHRTDWTSTSRAGFVWWIEVPLLPLIAAGAVLCGYACCREALARRRARWSANPCSNCNYDRAGIAADAKCPECGTKGAA
jgi:hypothetical protein